MTGLGAISGTTTHWLPLPPYRVGNMLHSMSGRFKMGLGWLVNACSSHFIGGGGYKPTKPRGSVPEIQGDNCTTEPDGIMEVAMLGFDLGWV